MKRMENFTVVAEPYASNMLNRLRDKRAGLVSDEDVKLAERRDRIMREFEVEDK